MSIGNKFWCYPEELLNSELEEAIEYLWEYFAFEDGSNMVREMIDECENEYNIRLWMKSRIKSSWRTAGFPKKGKPVIEVTFNPKGYKVVRWDIDFLGPYPYTYNKDHHYDPDETNP